MTLVEFLRARLDEDEQWARRTESSRRWKAVDGDRYGPQVRVGQGDIDDPGPEWRREVNVQVWQCDDEQDGCPDAARAWIAEAEHIARHDPARVLAEVDAKRRIVDAYELREAAGDTVGGYHATGLLLAIRLLVLPYADHPDCDESWRP